MTVYVFRNGQVVERPPARPAAAAAAYPTPMLSPRLEAFESPVTGREVSSWRERDRDMAAAGAVDPRDLPRKPFERRKERNERQRKLTPEWGGLDAAAGTATRS